MKNNNCFDCINHIDGIPAENTGWYHPCKFGIKNEGLQDVEKCEKWKPNKGFQIGGHYSHTHFEFDENSKNECMNLVIHSDGDFPVENRERMLVFHICDFRQIEGWVKFWGKYLKEKGVVVDEKKDHQPLKHVVEMEKLETIIQGLYYYMSDSIPVEEQTRVIEETVDAIMSAISGG